MANSVGQPLDRVDGRLKVTGGARYSAEFHPANVAYAALVQSPIARGRISRIDAGRAERESGVISVLTYLNRPPLAEPASPAGQTLPILGGPEIIYSGQTVAVVVADSFERATYAATLVHIDYEMDKPTTGLEEHLDQAFDPTVGGRSTDINRGDLAAGLTAAQITVNQTYTTPFLHHNPMEPHATVAFWQGDDLTVYDATQGVYGTRQALAQAFGLEQDQVRVVSHFLGGGFGCKGLSWPHTTIAALAARVVNRPVKLALQRQQMFTSNGHRPHTVQKMILGATGDGKLTALCHNGISSTSQCDEFVEPTGLMPNMMYSCPNVQVTQRLVRLDMGTPTYMRAPGEASGSFSIESAMDELAYAAKIDPVELRLLNYAEQDESEGHPWSSKSLRECYQLGAAHFEWQRRDPAPRSMSDGRYLIGMGMASATYPANFRAAQARARMFSDGRAVVQSATQDLGTGTYTVMTQVAADALSLPIEMVRFELGDTLYPESPGSGGSTSAASAGSAVHAAAQALRSQLIGMALSNESSPLFGLTPKQVKVENGSLFAADTPARSMTYGDILKLYSTRVVEARAGAAPGPERGGGDATVYSMHSFGAHFCKVRVDLELGQVRVERMVSAFGAGKILNAKTARSQFIGGITFGIGMALMEESVVDANLGRIVTRNLADYHVPVHADIPEIEVFWVDEEDKHVNPIGVKGIGEIGIVGAASAVANAVYHATGKRIRDLPITPDKLIA